MTPEQARDVLIAEVATVAATLLPGMLVVYENADEVPMDTAPQFFMRVGIDFDRAKQASMGSSPITRYDGCLVLTHVTKAGTGTKALLARAETINAQLRHYSLSTLQMGVPYPSGKESPKGWYAQTWCVPFWFHG